MAAIEDKQKQCGSAIHGCTREHVVLVSGSLHSPTVFNIFLRCRLMIAAKAVWDTREVVYNTARGDIPVPPWRAIY